MNSRTLLLLGAMSIAVIVFLGDQMGLLSFIDEWGAGHTSAMARVDKQIKIAQDIVMKGAEADAKLADYEHRSLPYNAEIARSNYQDWLTKLVEKNQISQSTVEVGTPTLATVSDGGKKKEAYKRYVFTLNGVGRLEQVTEFLFDFYQAGHLHKIRTLSLSPSGAGLFTVNVVGEAIAVATGDRATELSQAVGDRLESQLLEDYAVIVRRNVFSREVAVALRLVVLSSVTFDKAGFPEAWFKLGTSRTTKKLQRGDKLSISMHELEVLDIQPRSVLISVDGAVVVIELGKSLHEAMASA